MGVCLVCCIEPHLFPLNRLKRLHWENKMCFKKKKVEPLINKDDLIVPIYINEKIVLDMLAILDDGFSMVSQLKYDEHNENKTSQESAIGFAADVLSNLLGINLSGTLSHEKTSGQNTSISKEKFHTNASLLSKFRSFLFKENLLISDSDFSNIKCGDFIELNGELQKNPLINWLDNLDDLFRLAGVFSEQAESDENMNNAKIIQSFSKELKHSGTIDFILSSENGSVVLSIKEQYLSNDNLSEIIGGKFRVLGKVVSVSKEESEKIDLLRKTTLSILSEEMITNLFSGLNGETIPGINLPDLITTINGPALIVIPIAIYA